MTIRQLYLIDAVYFIVLIVVVVLTRATARRIVGAFAGGAALGVVALASIALGEKAGWWNMVMTWEPYFLTLMMIAFTMCAFIFLITWRIVRRFGWRGLAATLGLLAIIGPARDYTYMNRFPQWGSYASGIAPVLAVSASYVLFVALGHWVMWLIAGPAGNDRLSRRSWKVGQS
jgi:hypothetical protein